MNEPQLVFAGLGTGILLHNLWAAWRRTRTVETPPDRVVAVPTADVRSSRGRQDG
jgi:hypothetical protein